MLTRMVIFDEINFWSEIKLDIIQQYAAAYSKILAGQKNPELHHVYVDAFSGSGRHYSKAKKDFVLGSPLLALQLNPPFKEYYFIDIDKEKVEMLKSRLPDSKHIHILGGDCNVLLLDEVFPNIKYQHYRRGLCLLDPYGLDLNWDVVFKAGQMKSIEIFINFPVMDINRNVLWLSPEGVRNSDIQRMDAFWGDDSWKKIAYRELKDLFGESRQIRERIQVVAQAYKERLQKIAGFAHVSEPLPMRNTRRSIVYYLFFASHKPVARNIVTNIFNKYRV